MGFTSSLTWTSTTPKSILYSTNFSGCTGVLSVDKLANGVFNLKMSHFDPYQTGSYFQSNCKPQLSHIKPTSTVVLFVDGEYQKNEKGQWEVQPKSASQEVIARIEANSKIRNPIVVAYDSTKITGKPTNSLAAVFNPEQVKVSVYTDGNAENPYKPIIEIQ